MDRLIVAIARRSPRIKGGLVTLLVSLCCLHAVAIGLKTFRFVPGVSHLEGATSVYLRASGSMSGWAMFHEPPVRSEFQLQVVTGNVVGSEFIAVEELGPIVPGFGDFSSGSDLRYFTLFRQLKDIEKHRWCQDYFLRQVSRALLARYSDTSGSPIHFKVKLSEDLILTLDEARNRGEVSTPISYEMGPWAIGQTE